MGSLFGLALIAIACSEPPPTLITSALCGDGVIAEGERCDDGNRSAGDGCSASCAVEAGFACSNAGVACATVCGDGLVRGDERCDEGRDSTGCGSTCQPRLGFNCHGEGTGSCRPNCGDGRVVPGEACDDGNSSDGDGCSAACAVEEGFACHADQPSTCDTVCGDGILLGPETCDDGNLRSADGCSPTCVTRLAWRPLPSDVVPAARLNPASVWTGREIFVWGGWLGTTVVSDIRLYNPTTRAWRAVGAPGAPPARASTTAIWTGREVLIWGGEDTEGSYGDGARYDLAQNLWRPMSGAGAPSPRAGAPAVWTGTEMIIFGGADISEGLSAAGGAAYDPAADAWRPLSSDEAPSPRHSHVAAWTGTEMIIFGGWGELGGDLLGDGARYDPVSDTWRALPTEHAPPPSGALIGAWTGSEFLVFGAGANEATGAAYDPLTNTWRPLASRPLNGSGHAAAFWTGSELIASGGWAGTGAKYLPLTDAWSDLPSAGAPSARRDALVELAGRSLVIFGGADGSGTLEGGGQLDLLTGTWSRLPGHTGVLERFHHTAVAHGSRFFIFGGMFGEYQTAHESGTSIDVITGEVSRLPSAGAPSGRLEHAAVATEREMIIWGGLSSSDDETSVLGHGASYDFEADRWRPLPTSNAPAARSQHTATLAGSELIVWGGFTGTRPLNDGGRFDLTTRTWRPIAPDESTPSPRARHSATWTGTELIVWGGRAADGAVQTGALYDPQLDRWRPMSLDGAPTPRADHTAIWTGTELIIWGGSNGVRFFAEEYFDTGARYDPTLDRWTPISALGAPSRRSAHTASWTGAQMVVFGGSSEVGSLGDGARYDPQVDAWFPLPTERAPAARFGHSALWMESQLVLWGGSGDDLSAFSSGAILDL